MKVHLQVAFFILCAQLLRPKQVKRVKDVEREEVKNKIYQW